MHSQKHALLMHTCLSSSILSSLWCVRALSVLCCVQAQEAVCNRLAELLAVSSNHDLLMASKVTQRILGTLRANGGHTGVQVSTRTLRCSSALSPIFHTPPTFCPQLLPCLFRKVHQLFIVGYRLNVREFLSDPAGADSHSPPPLGVLFQCVRCKACLHWPTWLVTTTSRT